MRVDTVETEVFEYAELSAEAQETACEWYREHGLDHEWWDYCVDDAKRMGALMGIDVDNVYFSGFWSQGDGACFEGSYSYAKGGVAAIKSEAPQDSDLHAIAEELRGIQRRFFYQLSATVRHSGHYSHEYCTEIRVRDDRENVYSYETDSETESAMCDALRGFMRWIYERLESEYEWLNSDETVAENIAANDYEFTVDGTPHY